MPGLNAPAIQLLGLTKFYGRDRRIEDPLRVERGEVFGLLGLRSSFETLGERPAP